MDITQHIQKFYEVSQSRDFSRDCLYRVLSITFGDGSSTSFDEDDLVYIKGGKIPGRQITNQAVSYMGLAFNVPGTVKYTNSDSFNVQFWCDEKSILRNKLEQISRDIFDDKTSTGNYFQPKASAILDMVQLDKQLNVINHYKLVGISLRNINEISYDIAGDGKPVVIDCTLSYHYYETV